MRRAFPLLLAPLLALAACGDDSSTAATEPPSTETIPTDTLPPVETTEPPAATVAPGYSHPTGADDVVLRIASEGGFVPVGFAFTNVPVLIVTGDGRVIQQGITTMEFPGPLVPTLVERTITEEGIQALLALADEQGLLADVTYARNDLIADAPDTVVTLTVDGDTFEHRAYALGIDGSEDGGESDPARAALYDFVSVASSPAGVVADALGPEQVLEPDAYLVQARPVAGDPTTVGPSVPDAAAPPASLPVDETFTVVPWPEDAPIRLDAAARCAELPAEQFAGLFGEATQATYFSDGDVFYELSVTPKIPGRTC